MTLHGSAAAHRRCADWDCDLPFGWEDDRPVPVNPPLPEGFVLTVPIGPGHPGPATGAKLDRYRDVAAALGQCWNPVQDVGDRRWDAITLRVSFKRDGSINGVPRTIFGETSADAQTKDDLRRSLLSALSHCAPLPLSASLGKAIAGQIFAIRFIQEGHIK